MNNTESDSLILTRNMLVQKKRYPRSFGMVSYCANEYEFCN